MTGNELSFLVDVTIFFLLITWFGCASIAGAATLFLMSRGRNWERVTIWEEVSVWAICVLVGPWALVSTIVWAISCYEMEQRVLKVLRESKNSENQDPEENLGEDE